VANIKTSIANFQAIVNTMKANCNAVKVPYEALGKRVSDIYDPTRYNTSYGSTDTSLQALIEHIGSHVDTVNTWFLGLMNPGTLIFTNQDKVPGDKKAVFTKADALYSELLKVVASEVTTIKQVPKEVSVLHGMLLNMQLDVQKFYKAGFDLSTYCNLVEAKVIASDQVLSLCNAVSTSLLPLGALLKDLAGLDATDKSLPTVAADIKLLLSKTKLDAPLASATSYINTYFNFNDVQPAMAQLETTLRANTVEADVEAFAKELEKIIGLIVVKEKPSEALDPFSSSRNPVLDENTSLAFKAIVEMAETIPVEAPIL